MKIEKKVFISEVKEFDDKTLTISHFISTETQDSGGDIMRADGMKMRGKPVVLFQHGLDPVKGQEPIAKIIGISVGVNKDGKKGLIAKTQYYDGSKLNPPDNTGQRLYEKAKQGYMPNWSIGWAPLKYNPTANGGREVTEWELHEYSQVAVGMNEEATTDIKSILGDQTLPVIQIKEDVTPEAKPMPNSGESEDDFVKRCVPVVLEDGTTDDPAQAAAICHSKWREANKETATAEPKFFKSITERVAQQLPMNAMYTIIDAMIGEIWTQACQTQEDSGKISSDILTEFIGVFMPYMQAFIDACRKPENKGKGLDDYLREDMFSQTKKLLAEIKALTGTKTEPHAAVPAPAAEPVLLIKEPSPPAPEPVVVILETKELPNTNTMPKSGIELPCSVDELKKALSDEIKGSVNTAIRQAQGKLD